MSALTALFRQVLEISLALSALIALLLLARPLLQKRYRAKWAYWAWLLLALRLAVPFNPSLPRPPVQVPESTTAFYWQAGTRQPLKVLDAESAPNPGETDRPAGQPEQPEQLEQAAAPLRPILTLPQLAALLWAAGGLGFLGWHLIAYARFRRRIRRWIGPEADGEVSARFEALRAGAGARRLALARCPAISSPMVTGFLRPVLLLPAAHFSPQALDAIFRHELVHAKRHDIWYKLLLLLARCVHWFNPLVHLMARRAGRDLEIACDEAVVAGRDGAFRQDYGRAVLDAVECAGDERAPLTTYFKGGRGAMLERLKAILSTLPKRRGLALLAAVVLVAATVAAAVSFGGKAPGPDRTLETASFSLLLPQGVGYVSMELAAGGSAAEFSKNMAPAGGVWLATYPSETVVVGLFKHETPDFSRLLAGGNYGDYDEPLPQAAVLSSSAVAQGGWAGSAWEQLVEREGRRELHFIYQVTPLQFYDLWFRLDVVSQAEARESAATFLFGSYRTPSPDGTKVLSVYIQQEDTRYYLWSLDGQRPTLEAWAGLEPGEAWRSGGMTALGAPLWSPDGTRALLAAAGYWDSGIFLIPAGTDGPTDLQEGLAAGLAAAYVGAASPSYDRFLPRQWREDGGAFQFSFNVYGSDYSSSTGSAWCELDEAGTPTEITGYAEHPTAYAGPVLASAQAGGRTFTLREYWDDSLYLALDEFAPEAIPELLNPFDSSSIPRVFLSLPYGASHPFAASVTLEPFTDVLGEQGVVFSYLTRDGRQAVDYYYLRGDGTPTLLAAAYGELRQVDADGDGDAELLGSFLVSGGATLFDRRDGMIRTAPVDAAAAAALESGPLPGGLDSLAWGAFSPSSLGERHPQVSTAAPMYGAVLNQYYTLSLPQWLTLGREPDGPHGEAQIWLGDPSDGNLAGGILWQEGETEPFDSDTGYGFLLASRLGYAGTGSSSDSGTPDRVLIRGTAVATRPSEKTLHLICLAGENQVYHVWLRLDYVPEATAKAIFNSFSVTGQEGGA